MSSDPDLPRHYWPIAGLYTTLDALRDKGLVTSMGVDGLGGFTVAESANEKCGRLVLLTRDGFPGGYFEVMVPATVSRDRGLAALTELIGSACEELDWVQEYAEWPGVDPTADSIERELAHR